jgi:glycosyltransferase involved in cell wall biosynthesis
MGLARTAGLVSVIMPVYRGAPYVAAAIESALAQTYQPVELVIVNDGSPDDSAKEIARFLPHPQIRYLEQNNSGVANARNTAIDNSTGALIALLDQDDLWLPTKLEHQVAYLDAHPEVGLVHSRVNCIDRSGAACSCEGAISVYPFEGLCAGRLLLGNGIAPLTVLLRAACIDRAGKFDQRFSPADDWELWIRIARHDSLGFLDEVTAHYRFHGDNVSKDQLLMQLTVLKIMDAVCARFPDVTESIGVTPVTAARSRTLGLIAQALEVRGRGDEAGTYWKEAYQTGRDIETWLAWLGLSSRARKRVATLLDRKPRLNRILSWYLYKATTALWARSSATEKD